MFETEYKKVSRDKIEISANGKVLGWVTVWHKRENDQVNVTGKKLYRAKPIGGIPARIDCKTFSSAEAYILGSLGI